MHDNAVELSTLKGKIDLISLLHCVYGPINVFYGLIFAFYGLIFGAMFFAAFTEQTTKAPEVLFWLMVFFAVVFGGISLWMIVTGVCQGLSGWWLKSGKHQWLLRLTAILELLFIPYGTITGIYTLKILGNETYKAVVSGQQAFDANLMIKADYSQAKLQILSWLHRVTGVLSIFMSLFAVFYVGLGALFLLYPTQFITKGNETVEEVMLMGWLFVVLGAIFMVLILLYALLKLLAASGLKAAKNRTLCIITAAMECLVVPHGTALGVITLLTLMDDDVKALFEKA